MTTATNVSSAQREPELIGQTVVVMGGSSGIGLETARRARAEGAEVILPGATPKRLERAGRELTAKRTAAFDANDRCALGAFFRDLLARPIDHVMVTAGDPHYGRLIDDGSRRRPAARWTSMLLVLQIARHAAGKMRAGGTLVFMSRHRCTSPSCRSGIVTATAALPALGAGLALKLAPVRINLIAAGFVDTPLVRIPARG